MDMNITNNKELKKSRVSDEVRLSRQGEGYFLSLLSKYAILHKVDGSNDIGIDYFCEWLNQESATSTNALFAVQLKATKDGTVILKNLNQKDVDKSNLDLYEIKIKAKSGNSRGNFDIRIKPTTKEYWRGFEIPVYLFVVVLNDTKQNKLFYKRYTPLLHRTDKDQKFHLVSNNNLFLAFSNNLSKKGGFCRDLYVDYIRCHYKKGALFHRNPKDFGLNQFQEKRFFFGDMATNEYKNETVDMLKWVNTIKKILVEKYKWKLE